MLKSIAVIEISRKAGLIIPPPGKRCYVEINKTQRVELVYRKLKCKGGGIVWYFQCPVSKKRCTKLYLKGGYYVHRSQIKRFARLNKPIWYTNSPLDIILKKKQGYLDSVKRIEKEYFKKHYAGKPTKIYLKCLKLIEEGENISMLGIINGEYDNELITR